MFYLKSRNFCRIRKRLTYPKEFGIVGHIAEIKLSQTEEHIVCHYSIQYICFFLNKETDIPHHTSLQSATLHYTSSYVAAAEEDYCTKKLERTNQSNHMNVWIYNRINPKYFIIELDAIVCFGMNILTTTEMMIMIPYEVNGMPHNISFIRLLQKKTQHFQLKRMMTLLVAYSVRINIGCLSILLRKSRKVNSDTALGF